MLPAQLNGIPLEAGIDLKRGSGGTALYIARNKFAVLDKATHVNSFLMKNNNLDGPNQGYDEFPDQGFHGTQ